MEKLRLKESCLYARDLRRMRSFYEEVLGLEVISYVPDEHVFFRAGPCVLLCFHPEHSAQKKEPPPHYADGEQHLAFEASNSDFEAWQKQLSDQGILIEQFQAWHGGKKSSFYFRDPERNLIEILQEGVWYAE
ncbi:MAG: VOC family protein [Flavobacteriales bacterium]